MVKNINGYVSGTIFLILASILIGCGVNSTEISEQNGDIGKASVVIGAGNNKTTGSFDYTFPDEIVASTITPESFFIAPSAADCDPAARIDGILSCESVTKCAFTPNDRLSQCAEYQLCLTSDIQYASDQQFPGDIIVFNTVCCSELFNNSSCTNPEINPVTQEDNYSYDVLLQIENNSDLAAGTAECICAEAAGAGETGCIDMNTVISAQAACGYAIALDN